MADSWGNISRERLMETIVILWTLTEVPGGSNIHNPTHMPLENQAVRQLTFEREKGLVEIFAFLSGTTDDPSKVMAVCIEEGSAGNSLTIRLASNSGDCSDVVSGFERIATILEQSSGKGKESEVARHDLLREIVRLDFWRILSRLRSRHAKSSRKTSGKPSLILQLSGTTNSNLSQRGKKLSSEMLAKLKERVQNILTSAITLEDIPEAREDMGNVQDLLMVMLEQFSEIADDETLASLLDKVIDVDPGVKDHLNSAVGKLGRYYSASRDLIRAARTNKYSVFNSISVETCQLPQPPESCLVRTPSTLEAAVKNLISTEPTLQNCGLPVSIRNYLGKLYSAKAQNFKLRTSSSRTSWKVHAEIQLLFFYELHRADLPPRVICSSKSPCYLCHAFFDLYGRFYVPATHGKLYPGWILPTWVIEISDEKRQALGRAIDGLHAKLVLRIRQLVKKKRALVKPPNESTLWTTADWSASSLQSLLVSETSRRPANSGESIRQLEAVPKISEGYGISVKHQGSPSSSLQDQAVISAVDANSLVCDHPKSNVSSATMISHFLNPGEFANIKLTDVTVELRVSTKRLNLTFTRDSFYGDGVLETCWVRCSLLDSSAPPGADMTHQPVNVMSIMPGSEVTFETGSVYATSDLLIVACDEVLSIKYSAEESVGMPGISLDGTAALT